ncbi:MAG: HD domain-containing phosphohydrolase [Halanaerobiaceae bacterium]
MRWPKFKHIRSKLIIWGLLPVVLLLILNFVYIKPLIRDSIYEDKKDQVEDMVASGIGILFHYYEKEESGELSREEAQQQALETIRSMSYGSDNQNYYWINNYEPEVIIHPYRPDLLDQNLSDYTIAGDIHLFEEFVDLAREKGSGFMEYEWQYFDNEDRVEPKLSYLSNFEPWEWVLGTGVYVNDIDMIVEEQQQVLNFWSMVTGLIIIIIFSVIARSFNKPITALTDYSRKIAEGNYDLNIPDEYINRVDEIGVLAESYNKMSKELQETLHKLKKSKNYLSTTLNSIADGVITTDMEGRITRMNPIAEELTGWELKEARGKFFDKVFKIVNTHTGKIVESPVQKVINQGEVIGLANDTTLLARDGSRYQIADGASPIQDEEGILGVVVVFSDITEKYKTRQKVNKLVEEQEILLNNIEVQIWFLKTPEIHGKVNKARAEFMGKEREEVEGSSYYDLYPEKKDAEYCIRKNKKVFNKKEKIESESEVVNSEGEKRILSVTKIPKLNEQGEVEYVVCSAVDVTDEREKEKEIRYLGFHDNLTDLYNRTFLEEEIKRLDVKRQLPLSLIMADLNGLKLVNDTYGHDKGDEILIKTAKILSKSCRKEDIIARWGGDEFVILLPQTSRKDARKVYNRIKSACDSTGKASQNKIPVSIALGIATKKKEDEDIFEILRKAEDRMYNNKRTESKSAKSNILKTLLNTLGEKSNETREHARRLQKLALSLGNKLNLPPSELDRLSLLATLHDIGKTLIPEDILNKKGKLNQEEWEVMTRHPETGNHIASSTREFAHVAEGILAHHERWDGTGYPRGLKEEEIPLLARIISIVDAYDVMTNGRPYKEPMSKEEALKELKRCAGSQFDPELVEKFIEIHQNK